MEEKLLEEMQRLLGHGVTTMDESGRRNQEGNSYMLWEERWNEVRADMVKAIDVSKELKIMLSHSLPPARFQARKRNHF